jgi:hypothetical protein
MTDAPQLLNPFEPIVASWRAELSGQLSVSASGVQDRLLDLWGHVPEGDARSQIEKWLTETLERNLYEVADIERRLDRLVTEVAGREEPSPAG